MWSLPIPRRLFRWPESRKWLLSFFQSVEINWRIRRRLHLELSRHLVFQLNCDSWRGGTNYYTRLGRFDPRRSRRRSCRRRSCRTKMVRKQNFLSYSQSWPERFDDCSADAYTLKSRPHWVVYVDVFKIYALLYLSYSLRLEWRAIIVFWSRSFLPAGAKAVDLPPKIFPISSFDWTSCISLMQALSLAPLCNSSDHYHKSMPNLTQLWLYNLSAQIFAMF